MRSFFYFIRLIRKTTCPLILGALVAGCAKESKVSNTTFRSVPEWDITFKKERDALKNEPIPTLESTPYDADKDLRQIYLTGFNTGWKTTIDCYIGALVSSPDECDSPAKEKAWRAGYHAGENALLERLGHSSKEKAAPPKQ